MLSFTRKNGQLSFYLAHKLYKNGPKKGTVPEKINSHSKPFARGMMPKLGFSRKPRIVAPAFTNRNPG